MIPNTHKDYYGDETRWFVGSVKSLNDPLELGRVKVRIFGVHSENTDDVPEGDLPFFNKLYLFSLSEVYARCVFKFLT